MANLLDHVDALFLISNLTQFLQQSVTAGIHQRDHVFHL